MSGYSGTPLVRKLGLRSGMKARVVDAPDNYFDLLVGLPELTWLSRLGKDMDFVHVFADSVASLDRWFPGAKDAISPGGMIWISWPKKSSGVETDIDERIVRHTGLSLGLVDVKVCAVDETWSGLKFVYRVADRPRPR